MTTILVDHDIEGHALLLWARISTEGWSDLLSLRLVLFDDVGLPTDGSDRDVWRFAQQNGMVLLTGNRRMKEADSLEKTIREENTPVSLPVVTIGNVSRMLDRGYLERCKLRLLEVMLYLDYYAGAGRVFIP